MIVLTISKATKRRNRIQGAPRPLHAWQRCKFVLCKSQDEIILFLSLLRNEPECQIRIQIKSLVELSSTSRGMLAENVSEDNSIVNIWSGHHLSPPQLIAFWALSSSHAKIQLTQCLFADILDGVGFLVSLPLSRFAVFANWRPTPAELWATEMRRWLAVPNRARSPS